jgi:AcrR family transcriptional regulator
MLRRGVGAVTIDDVGRATSTSKSQMYHYFVSKEELVDAVVGHVGVQVLALQESLLGEMSSIDDVQRWADALVSYQRERGKFCGCPLGSLASELCVEVRPPQPQIELYFEQWTCLLEQGISRMVTNGLLRASADPRRLAVATLASLQGGLLMAKVTQDESFLQISLDAAIDYLRSFAVSASIR